MKKHSFAYCGLIALIVLLSIYFFKKDILIPTSKIEKSSENQTSFLEKNPNTIEIIEDDIWQYTLIKSFTSRQLDDLIPVETNYKFYDLMSIKDNIVIFAIRCDKNSSNHQYVFSYDVNANKIISLYDVSNLNLIIQEAYLIDNNIYIYGLTNGSTGVSSRIYACNEDTVKNLSQNSTRLKKYRDGIVFIDNDECKITTILPNKNITTKDLNFFTSDVLEGNNLAAYTLLSGNIAKQTAGETKSKTMLYVMNDDGTVLKNYQFPGYNNFVMFDNLFFLIENTTNEKYENLHIYNYNGDEITSFKQKITYYWKGNGSDTLFFTNSDNDFCEYYYDTEKNILFKFKINNNYYYDYTAYSNQLICTKNSLETDEYITFDVFER